MGWASRGGGRWGGRKLRQVPSVFALEVVPALRERTWEVQGGAQAELRRPEKGFGYGGGG
jgi:hypothetical protein